MKGFRVWACIFVLIYSQGVLADGRSCVRALELLALDQGRSLSLTIKRDNGEKLRLNGIMQIERESRIEITPESNPQIRITKNRADYVGPEYRDLKRLTAQLLNAKFSDNFSFAPLEVDEFTCHGSWYFRQKCTKSSSNGFRGETLTTIVSGPWTDRPDLGPRDWVSADYTVNAKFELAQYFDTEDLQLERQGIAVRVKRWYSYYEEDPLGTAPVATMITLKRLIGLAENIQGREEWQVKVPDDLTESEIKRVMIELAKKAKVGLSDELKVRTPVQNQRLGIKWMLGERHIGFLTIDRFGLNLNDAANVHAQLELEILSDPAVLNLVRRNYSAFVKFLNELKRSVDGRFIGDQPKVAALAMKPMRRPAAVASLGPISKFITFRTRAAVQGFEIFVPTLLNGHILLAKLEPAGDFETDQISARRARIKFEGDTIEIRENSTSPWRPIAKRTGNEIQGLKDGFDQNALGIEYIITEPGSVSVGENQTLVVDFNSATPSP